MNRMKVHFSVKILLSVALCLMMVALVKKPAYASQPTDEILNYAITVDVNSDATLTLRYHIDWLVLDSDSLGPLDWVKIGLPNRHVLSSMALSENIDNIDIDGEYAKIYFDKKYYEGEIASFDFEIIQDYMYMANSPEAGMCKYSFTPGWFDDIEVDKLTISWNADNAESWTPDCLNKNGYLTWETSLSKGGTYTVGVIYNEDAYGFNMAMDNSSGSDDNIIVDIIAAIFMLIFGGMLCIGPVAFIFFIMYLVNGGFSQRAGSAGKKITRTKVVYYPTCQSCGASRKDGEKFCTYCGRSFIQSEEKIEEKDIPPEEKELLRKDKNGEYRFSSSPNTYMRINVVHIPVSRPVTTSSRSGSHHSSCAHSSCACACACACAGGGRAGCTTKDFYNTKLKMRFIDKAAK